MISLTSKKGDLPDMLIFMITIFVFAIGLLVLAFVIPSIIGDTNDTCSYEKYISAFL